MATDIGQAFVQIVPSARGIKGSIEGVLGGEAVTTTAQGLMYLAACLPMAFVGFVSAVHQGKTSAASIGIVAKREDQFGKAMLFPAMVETYAILALLVSILAITNI